MPTFIWEWVTIRAFTTKVKILEPTTILWRTSLFTNIFKCPEISANMVKYAIKNNFNAILMKFIANVFEWFICAKPVINYTIVISVISMNSRFKNRTKIDCIYTHTFKMRNPIDYLIKTADGFTVINSWCATESNRIDVIKYRFVYPITHFPISFFEQ